LGCGSRQHIGVCNCKPPARPQQGEGEKWPIASFCCLKGDWPVFLFFSLTVNMQFIKQGHGEVWLLNSVSGYVGFFCQPIYYGIKIV